MIALVFTGGTISMRNDPASGGAVPTLRGDAILASAPDAQGVLYDLPEVIAGAAPLPPETVV